MKKTNKTNISPKANACIFTINAKKEQLNWTVALISPSNWHMLVNISTISSSTSSSRAEILLHFDGRISAKLHSAEYVIETKGRPEKKLKKMLHVILTVKHTYKLFTLTGRNPS